LVQAAATITRKDLQIWDGVDEIRRSRHKNEELRRDIKRKVERLPEYIEKIPRTFRAFAETCFGWKMGIEQTLPRVSPSEESVLSLADDIEEGTNKKLVLIFFRQTFLHQRRELCVLQIGAVQAAG